MTDLIRLAERVEALTGPDRGIDAEIALALNIYVRERRGKDRQEWFYKVGGEDWERRSTHRYAGRDGLPSYTESLDAAMTLIGNSWWSIEAGCDGSFFAKVLPWAVDCRGGAASNAAIPALALTAASLRSIAAQRGES